MTEPKAHIIQIPNSRGLRVAPMIWSQREGVAPSSCPVCGKVIRDRGWRVYVYGYDKVVHPDDIEEAKAHPYDTADGAWEIGPECRKRFGEFAYRVEP